MSTLIAESKTKALHLNIVKLKTSILKLKQHVHLCDTSSSPGRDCPFFDPRYKTRLCAELKLILAVPYKSGLDFECGQIYYPVLRTSMLQTIHADKVNKEGYQDVTDVQH